MVGGSNRKPGVAAAEFGAGGCPAGFDGGWMDGFAGCDGVWPGAVPDACGRLTWRNSMVLAVPISMARWLISFTSVPRMTCGVMANTVSSEEWSVEVWPKRYLRMGICANPGIPLSDL